MFVNRYIQRRVAEVDSKACFLCYRPTTSVMVNEAPSADYFYACDSHLSDPGFATIDKECQLAMKQREEKQKEIELLRAQWDDVQKKKNTSKENSKDTEKKDEDKKGDTNGASGSNLSASNPPIDTKPIKPIYELNRGVYNLRLGNKRRVAHEKKTKMLLETPGLFPEVPRHKPT